MNINLIKSRFTPEMLEAIKNEVETFVQEKFSANDYTMNKYLVDTFFVQPIFYATLLNYYTMYEQRSSISLSDIYSDDAISPTKKDAFFSSFASDMGIDTTNMTSDDIVSTIENKLTVSDTKIHSDMINIINTYDKAINGVTGDGWTMFRNSPDLMYFSQNKFGAAMMYEGLSSLIEIVDIMNQPITMGDIERYKSISNAGRITNMIDVYVDASINTKQIVFNLSDGETDTITLSAKKYKNFHIPEEARDKIKCTFMEGGYIGFPSRSITLEATGPVSVTIDVESYSDDIDKEKEIKSNFPSYNIEFFGLLPVYLDITVQNKNALSKIISYMGKAMDGIKWISKIAELERILKKSNNSIIGIEATIWINPLVSKRINIYNNNLALSPKSIFSWIDISNTCVQASTITDMETGDVTSL